MVVQSADEMLGSRSHVGSCDTFAVIDAWQAARAIAPSARNDAYDFITTSLLRFVAERFVEAVRRTHVLVESDVVPRARIHVRLVQHHVPHPTPVPISARL